MSTGYRITYYARIITTKTTTNKTMKMTNNDCVGIRGNTKLVRGNTYE